MIDLLGEMGVREHKHDGKIRDFLNKLNEDAVKYKTRIYYAMTDNEDSNVEFTYTDENGIPQYRQKVIK